MSDADTAGRRPLIGVVGVTLTGNLGGQVMLHAVRQQLLRRFPSARLRLFSIYPDDDTKACSDPSLEVVPATPLKLVLFDLPASVLMLALSGLVGHRAMLRVAPAHVRRLNECDIVVDLSGIAFVSDRGLPLLAYNLACVVPSLAAGVAHFKLAQSLGPFGAAPLKTVARWVLTKCRTVIPRGRQSSIHLREIGFDVAPLPDVSFALSLDVEDVERARAVLPTSLFPGGFAVVSPSRVTRRSCEKAGVDYIRCLASACTELVDAGYSVLLVAHSIKQGGSKNNDLEEISELVAAMGRAPQIHAMPPIEDARVLRALFSLAEFAVTSRFHATVAALSGSVPLVTIGWNYKYKELLDSFGCSGQLLDTHTLTPESLSQAVRRAVSQRETLKDLIASHLPAVVAQAALNFSGPFAELERFESGLNSTDAEDGGRLGAAP